MKHVGFVDYYLSEWHANNYPAWIDELGAEYKVTHAWAETDVSPVDNVNSEQWCEKFGVKLCASIDELCKECDAIIILAPSHPEKHYEYAKEVFKYGKPTYIDKAFAPNIDEAVAIFELAEKYSVPFFSTSALRYATELDALSGCRNFIITGGGRNFPEYCIHTIEMAVKLLDDEVEKVDKICQGNQRICSVSTVNGKKATVIYTPHLAFSVAAERADGTPLYAKIESDFFRNLIRDMVNFFDTHKVSFNTEETLKCIKLRDSFLS